MADYKRLPFGFHIGSGGGNREGLGTYVQRLSEAGIPFVIMSADDMPYWEQEVARSSSVENFVGFRRSVEHEGTRPPSNDPNVPDYNKDPVEAAREHAEWHCNHYPSELDGSITWVTDINEPRHKEEDHPGITEWLAEFSMESARYHWSRGYKYVALNFAGGNHPEWDKTGPKMKELYQMAADNSDRLMIGTHEYSWTTSDILAGGGSLVGRIVLEVLDHMPSVPVVVTEFGWSETGVPNPEQAMADYYEVAETYYNRAGLKFAATWYLGPGFKDIANDCQRLIEPLTNLTLTTEVEVPDKPEVPPIDPPDPPCEDKRLGDARTPYTRVYWRVNSNATLDEWLATCKEAYDNKGTVGFSNDDAGIGVGLKRKKVIEVGWEFDPAIIENWYKDEYGVDVIAHMNYPGSETPPPINPPPSGASDVKYGIHTSADSHIMGGDLDMMRAMKPNTIKLLSGFPQHQVQQIVQEWPNANYVVRAFLSFGGRQVTPEEFYNWTIGDVVRTVDTLAAHGVGRDRLFLELHNEPNLEPEGLFSAWQNGSEFGEWLINVAIRYKEALGHKVQLLYPGLSPGTEIPGIRQESKAFFLSSKAALEVVDAVALHGYWSPTYDKYTHPYAIIQTVDWYNENSNGKELHITEACNNSGSVSRPDKAHEYTEVWHALKRRPNIKTLAFFVLSASNPAWGDAGSRETWTMEMADIAGQRFG